MKSREEGSRGAECVVRVFVLGWGKVTFQKLHVENILVITVNKGLCLCD